jgi:HAMP domain-containing protein
MAKQTVLTAAALALLAACNGPTAPRPTPPPQPEPATEAEAPPPPLLGGPRDETVDHGNLLGGPYATPEKPGPLTTFRRADGVEVTVMRPIPNPEEGRPAPRRGRGPTHAAVAPPAPIPAPAKPAEALAPTTPLPPPKLVEQARRAPAPHGVHHKLHIRRPAGPRAVVPPPAPPAAKPSLVDRMSDDRVRTPGGEASPKALLGGLLLLAAMVLLVAIARRLARAREARERARRAAARQVIETPAAETPPEPKPAA